MNKTKQLPPGIHIKDSRDMREVKNETVTLVVTSPPYNVNLSYEKDVKFEDWLSLMKDVLQECNRVLINGGRACINVANTGRNPYIPLIYHVMGMAFDLKWWLRGIVIWLKGNEKDEIGFKKGDIFVSKSSTGWGSFGRATNPVLRDNHEFILVFNKGEPRIPDGISGILPDEFVRFTNAEWIFSPDSARIVKHPSPFPDELVRRCILLYSNEGDTVLDPFGGSGTTYKVAKFLNRIPVIYEIQDEFIPVILKRIEEPVHIQSKAWDLYQEMKEIAPDLCDKTTRELKEIAKSCFIPTNPSMKKFELINKILEYRRNVGIIKKNLNKWIS
jgi:site-specific DNA-methyltransferase (adenine-specific)